MRSSDIGVLPVIDGLSLVGILTDRDITLRTGAEGLDSKTTTVKETMTPGVIYCPKDTELTRAAGIMEERKICRLLALDTDGRLAGIVTTGDIAVRVRNRYLAGEILAGVCKPLVRSVA